MRNTCRFWLPLFVLGFATTTVSAQSFRVQCPPSTITHPNAATKEPDYTAPTIYKCSVNQGCSGFQGTVSNAGPNNTGYLMPAGAANGAVKCQQISGGDGFSTMGDGTQTYMFSFGPLSGLAAIANGQPGTEFPNVFNTVYLDTNAVPLLPGDPATTDNLGGSFTFNGAIGLTGDQQITPPSGKTATASPVFAAGAVTGVTITDPGSGYVMPPTVTFSAPQQPTGLTPDAVAVIAGGQVVYHAE